MKGILYAQEMFLLTILCFIIIIKFTFVGYHVFSLLSLDFMPHKYTFVAHVKHMF